MHWLMYYLVARLLRGYIEDDQEREAAGARQKKAMVEEHAKAKHGMQEDFCKRLVKHFTSQAAKKQKTGKK